MLGIWPDTPQGIIIRQAPGAGNNAILILENTGPSQANFGYTFGIDATGLLTWAASTNTSVTGWDTALWRSAANTLSLGITTGTPDASGTLKLAKVSIVSAGAPTNAATAGTQGDIIQYGGYIYLCVVTGAAGAATWAKLTAVNLLA